MTREKRHNVALGDQIDILITSVGKKGDGVGKHDGMIVIVPNSRPGDKLRVEIKHLRPNCAFAEEVTD